MNSTLLGIILVFIFFLILTLIKKDSKFSKFGINLNRVYCPKCNLKQPIIRKPKNEHQMLYGGFTCEKCKTEMDKYGVEFQQ